MPKRMLGALCALLCGAVIGTTVLAPTTVHADDDTALGKTKEGLSEYKKGNWREAIKLFDDALAENPTDVGARKLRDEVGEELLFDMVNNNLADSGLSGRYSRFAKWLLARRHKSAFQGRENSPTEIQKHVDAYIGDDDPAKNLIRAGQIRDRYGDFAVPYIQANYMHSDNKMHRYKARTLLASLGAQAVNALIQVMQSPELYDRQTAALALLDIADPRALPVLATHFQMADEDTQVKEACARGIEVIRSGMPEADLKVNKARDLWFLQAEGYYRNNAAGRYWRNRVVGSTYIGNLPVAMFGYERTYTAWKWIPSEDGGTLLHQEVPLWAYADILAEESAVQAFELGVKGTGGNGNSDAWLQDCEALLACVHTHMWAEARSRYYSGNDEERKHIVRLLGERGMTPQLSGLGMAASSGSPRLYRALERSLADGYPHVSVALCDAIAAQDDAKAVGTKAMAPLLRALDDNDKRVKYAAARALVHLGRSKGVGRNTDVEQALATTLQETQARAVLVIGEDESFRSKYLTAIENELNYSATGANTLESGADLATQGPVFDAIIIQGDLALAPTFLYEPTSLGGESGTGKQRMETIFDILTQDIRTAGIPIIVALKDGDSSRKDTINRAASERSVTFDDNNYISYSDSSEADFTNLGDVLTYHWEQDPTSSKNRSNAMVIAAANAMATVDPSNTKFNVQSLLKALAGGLVLDGRSSDARVAICDAIAVLVQSTKGTGAGWLTANVVPNLVTVISDGIPEQSSVNTPLVRAAAARALGEIYNHHAGCFNDEGLDALLKQIRYEIDLASIEDTDRREQAISEVAEARNAAGAALGKAPTTAAQRLKIAKAQAANRHAAHPDRRVADGE